MATEAEEVSAALRYQVSASECLLVLDHVTRKLDQTCWACGSWGPVYGPNPNSGLVVESSIREHGVECTTQSNLAAALSISWDCLMSSRTEQLTIV